MRFYISINLLKVYFNTFENESSEYIFINDGSTDGSSGIFKRAY